MIIALFLFWIILSGQWAAFFIVAGCVSVWFVILIDRKLFLPMSLNVNWHWFILIFKLFKDMLASSFRVMKIILLNKEVESSVTWVDNPENEQVAQVAYANAITLTPGTMSMELKDNKILVHTIREQK